MASHALDQRLFEQMTATLAEGDPAETAPTSGVSIINGWLKVIDGQNSTETIAGRLKELRGQLQLAKPDPDRIRGLMLDLADDTSQISQGAHLQPMLAGKLEIVIRSLRVFAGKL